MEWDDSSFASLETNKEHIDTLILEELSLTESGMYLLYPDKFNRTQTYLKTNDPNLPIQALINNYNQANNIWDTKLLGKILGDNTKRIALEN